MKKSKKPEKPFGWERSEEAWDKAISDHGDWDFERPWYLKQMYSGDPRRYANFQKIEKRLKIKLKKIYELSADEVDDKYDELLEDPNFGNCRPGVDDHQYTLERQIMTFKE